MLCTELWHWLNVMLCGEDPGLPKIDVAKMGCPHTAKVNSSAFIAVLYMLLLDTLFMEHLESFLTPDVHDGYKFVWKMLVCLKETTTHNMKTASGVIVKFIEALVMAHYIDAQHCLTTGECWDILWALAPHAMDWWTIECEQWSQCPTGQHTTQFHAFRYDTNAVELPSKCVWEATDDEGNTTGMWQWRVEEEVALDCPGDGSEDVPMDCGAMRWRRLAIVGMSSDHFVLRFEKGCDKALMDQISSGNIVWFNGTGWAVWGGAWKFGDGRVDCCYLVPKKSGELYWARFNTEKGKITEPGRLKAKNCVDLICVRPPASCWCGGYNHGNMAQCTRRGCKRSAHKECIKAAFPGYRMKKWYNGKGCQQPHCIQLRAQRDAAKAAKENEI